MSPAVLERTRLAALDAATERLDVQALRCCDLSGDQRLLGVTQRRRRVAKRAEDVTHDVGSVRGDLTVVHQRGHDAARIETYVARFVLLEGSERNRVRDVLDADFGERHPHLLAGHTHWRVIEMHSVLRRLRVGHVRLRLASTARVVRVLRGLLHAVLERALDR